MSRAGTGNYVHCCRQRDATRGLLRILGLAFGVATVVGGVVGMGILRAPGTIVPQPSLIAVAVMAAAVPLFRYVCPARVRPVGSDSPLSSP